MRINILSREIFMLLRPLLFAVAVQCAFSGIMLSQNLRGMTLNEAIDAAKEKYINDLNNYWGIIMNLGDLRSSTLFWEKILM